MVREMKLKHVVIHNNIMHEFNVLHCGIKVTVTIALAKFNCYFSKSSEDGFSWQTVI